MSSSVGDFFSLGDTPGVSDVSFTGLDDTSLGFSDPTLLQDVSSTGSPLQLDTSNGVNNTVSTYDMFGLDDPFSSLALSGVSDPPFASASKSTPTPGGTQFSSDTANGLSALSKFGSSIAGLMVNHPQTLSPSSMPVSTATTKQQPLGGVNGTSLTLLLIIAGAVVVLIAYGGGR